MTGPTGAGKTTTLYSCLHFINRPDRKFITVEDPVEYVLAGINQVQVSEAAGLSFSGALRSILSQAPNIIMIGEIRDETASIAIGASLTGHLAFSTLHTNDAPGAVTRLIDMGVKPFLVASSTRRYWRNGGPEDLQIAANPGSLSYTILHSLVLPHGQATPFSVNALSVKLRIGFGFPC